MSKPRQPPPKNQALAREGALNPHPEAVDDPLFRTHPFFDPEDLVQVRYEMIRRHSIEGVSISAAAAAFGVSRPTFYKAQSSLARSGLAGLLPQPRGPKGGHKLSADVLAFAADLKASQPMLTTTQCLAAITTQFGIKVHRRSLERALAHKKNCAVRSPDHSGAHCQRLRGAARLGAGWRADPGARFCNSSPTRIGQLGQATAPQTRGPAALHRAGSGTKPDAGRGARRERTGPCFCQYRRRVGYGGKS
jgi:transposase